MADVKALLFFMLGLAVLLAIVFGVAYLLAHFGLLFIIAGYAVIYAVLLIGFLVFTPGLVRGPWQRG